ncbi:MAG: PIN domain-containing protein [Prochlorococcaceae cyanobacterium]
MRGFIDTNLWAYRLDRREPSKAEQISEWLAEVSANHEVVISTQVLIELRSVVTRKLKPALNAEQVGSLLEALSGFEVVGTNANLVLDAHQLAVAEQLSWFDALIVEAALRSRCEVLFSEDFNHGSQIGALQLINPLLAS